jgi:hypothetical protein
MLFHQKLDKKVLPLPKISVVKSERHLSLKHLISFVVVFGALGSFLLYSSYATQAVVTSLDSTQMTLPTGAFTFNASQTVSGKAVIFTAPGTATGTVTIPSGASISSMSVRTKAIECVGWPHLTITVDGKAGIPLTKVTSSVWTTYVGNVTLASGSHSVAFITGDHVGQTTGSCSRYLYLDDITFYGTPPPPVPTVAFSASPKIVTTGSSSTLTWTSTNATSCSATGAWNGSQPTSGSASTGALNTNSTYTLNCTGAGGSASQTVGVMAEPGPIYNATAYGAICDGNLRTSSISLLSVDGYAIQQAINAAEKTGGTVLLPAGTCELNLALHLSQGNGITLAGTLSNTSQRLTTITDSVNPVNEGGDLQIHSDHNTVQDLILNQLAYGGTSYVEANYTTFQRDAILGGPNFFVVFFVAQKSGAHAVGNQLLNSTVVSLIDKLVLGGTQPCDDGISWSSQDQSLIQNVNFTGTRLALYQDSNTTVNYFSYHPGPQSCGLDGFYISSPSNNLNLENLTMYGSAGVISGDGTKATTSNISITNEKVLAPTAGVGYSLNGGSHGLQIRNVQTVTINNISFNPANTSNDSIQIEPTVAANNITVENSIIPRVSFYGQSPQGGGSLGTISKAVFSNDTFPVFVPATGGNSTETFVNGTGAATTFSVSGGVWKNEQTQNTKTYGFFKGNNTTYSVTNLSGYSCPPLLFCN